MATNYYIYKFADFELDEKEEKITRRIEEEPYIEEITLTETEFKILLMLVRTDQAVSKEDFLDDIWGLNSEAQESNVAVHISRIRNKLGGGLERYIETLPHRRGYKFAEPVTPHKKKSDSSVTNLFNEAAPEEEEAKSRHEETKSKDNRVEIETALGFGTREFTGAAIGMLFAAGLFYTGYQLKSCPADCFEQNVYIAFASSFYAVLTGIGMFLECAYRFDRYGWRAIKMLPSMFLVAAGAMFAALAAAEYHLPDKIGYAFVSGCALMIIGAGISCFLAGYILPGEQITAARMPTQSAFAAFCKNILIYFFPIYAIFGVLIFCLIYGSSSAARNVAYPIGLFIVLLVFFVISHFSTNVLLQNLLTPKDGDEYRYYGMFSSLIMFRTIFMFGTALVSLVYYFTSAAGY